MIELLEKITVDVGEHGEGYAWEIDPHQTKTITVNRRYPEDWPRAPETDDPVPCQHCVEIGREEGFNRPDPRHKWTTVTYRFTAVVAYNEGHYNSTAICLSCLIAPLQTRGIVNQHQ